MYDAIILGIILILLLFTYYLTKKPQRKESNSLIYFDNSRIYLNILILLYLIYFLIFYLSKKDLYYFIIILALVGLTYVYILIKIIKIKNYFVNIYKDYIIYKPSNKKLKFNEIKYIKVHKKYVIIYTNDKKYKLDKKLQNINILSDLLTFYIKDKSISHKLLLSLYRGRTYAYNEDEFKTIFIDAKAYDLFKEITYSNLLILEENLPNDKKEAYDKKGIIIKINEFLTKLTKQYYNNNFLILGLTLDFYSRKALVYILNDNNKESLELILKISKKYKLNFIKKSNEKPDLELIDNLLPDEEEFETICTNHNISKYLMNGILYNKKVLVYIVLFFKNIDDYFLIEQRLKSLNLNLIDTINKNNSNDLKWKNEIYNCQLVFNTEISFNKEQIEFLVTSIIKIIKPNAQFGFWTLDFDDTLKLFNFEEYRKL